MEVLIKPIITEKTMRLANELNQYSFIVSSKASKIAVRNAVREKFDVNVVNVKILNVLGKKVTFGKKRHEGRKSNFKKAIVALKEGQTIEIFNLK